MKRVLLRLLATFGFAPLLAAQPTAGSSDAPFGCLFQGVTAEQRTAAAVAASQRLTDAPQDGERRGGAALNAILASLPRCAAAGRWTEAQRDMARLYLLTQLAREQMSRHYAAQNVDLTFIDRALTAPGPSAPVNVEVMAARVRAQGVTGQRPDSAEDIVYIYVQLLVQAAEARRGFTNPGSLSR